MISRILAVVLALLLSAGLATAECRADRVDLRGDWGNVSFSVELAADNATRARGLMFRESMPRFSGMLFVYDHPVAARFWMRNTLIPLDMIFINRFGVVKRIHKEAIPHDETVINGGNGVLAVLEVNGGLVDQLGIEVGTEIRHPEFGKTAKWACNPT